MCTVTFLPTNSGFELRMNRDERLTREIAQAPAHFVVDGLNTIYPFERTGGTWIAVNEHGAAFTLLNWNIPYKPAARESSRGLVIPRLAACSSMAHAERRLRGFKLGDAKPFRLIGLFSSERGVTEWRWDGAALASVTHDWNVNAWFSSGLSDEHAEANRRAAFDRLLAGNGDTGRQLQNFHRSHLPAPGPFSVCVHREDARSVSYSEVVVTSHDIQFAYFAGSPCEMTAAAVAHMISRAPAQQSRPASIRPC